MLLKSLCSLRCSKAVILFFALLFSTTAFAQTKLTWDILSDVEYESKYFEEYGTSYLAPTFGEKPTALNGKKVVVTGYLIPLDAANEAFILSKNPYASCYFCGNAGPETIVELWIKPKKIRRYQMDERLTFKGKLYLNESDVNHFNYILRGAEEY